MVNGRLKGGRNELQVCKLLTKWWQGVEPGCTFVRSPGSGGWANAKIRGEFEASGDLMTSARHFPFCVESKCVEGWSEKNVLKGKPSPVWAWWRQAQRAATEVSKMPALFFRKAYKPWRVMLPEMYVTLLPRVDELPDNECWAWTRMDLACEGVDYGPLHPIVYLAEPLLAVDPGVFLGGLDAVASVG